MLRVWQLVTALVVVLAIPAAAQQAPAAAPSKKNPFGDTPCSAAYLDHCGHTRGWRLGHDCLIPLHEKKELPEECSAHLEAVEEERRQKVADFNRKWRAGCAEEIPKFCSQYENGITIRGCLNQVRDQLSPECSKSLPYRNTYSGPGYMGFRDGSEPENFDEERRKRLHPNKAAKEEADKKAEAERAAGREKARAHIEANRKAKEAEDAAAKETADAAAAE